jgi:hypothetical protein
MTNPNCAIPASVRDPANAIDGDTTTRYTDGVTQAGGEYAIVDLGGLAKISGITILANPATDAAKAYKVEYSTNGVDFGAFIPAVAGVGGVSPLVIDFPGATILRAFKITQTGMTPFPATSWWSINEITLTGCVDQ